MSVNKLWQDRFEELVVFKNHKEHCCVPRTKGDNKTLANLVINQRYQYKLMKEGKKSSLNADKIEKLEAIGFTWQIYEPNIVFWIEQYEELKQYKLHKGHCKVPMRYKDNQSLGIWVLNQKQHYRLMNEGRTSSLSTDKIETLNDRGFT